MLPNICPDNDAMFFDIDGTLIDIAPTPYEVIMPTNLINSLEQLYKKLGGAIALVSGRSLMVIDSLFAPLKLPAAGVHGAELRLNEKLLMSQPIPQSIRESIYFAFNSYPEIIIEDKKYTIAVHYRQAPDFEEKIYNILQKIINDKEEEIKILKGKMVFEITKSNFNKGTAVKFFMEHPPFMGRKPMFIGDDETDSFAMEVCKKMGGIGIWVDKYYTSKEYVSTAQVREWIDNQLQ
jgi:trehalose 6-phosphate phosphatase